MIFQAEQNTIRWKLHLRSSPQTVYQMLATEAGRAQFWAESAVEEDRFIHFQFPNGLRWNARILAAEPYSRYQVEYLGGSLTTFDLVNDGSGGTDLSMSDTGVPGDDRTEVIAGWVSVLMALKAAVDFKIDLRNHDPKRTWDQGFVEN
jgi:uncharacterized protein YndB with AHSA1/START domain